MSIEKRLTKTGDPRYRVTVWHQGRKVATKTFVKKRDAIRWESETLSGLVNGHEVKSEKLKVFSNKYLSFIYDDREYKTYRCYRSDLINHILPKLGDLNMSKLSESDVKSFRSTLVKSKGLSNRTANKIVNVLKGLLTYAVESKALRVNPVSKLPELSVDSSKVSEFNYWDNHEATKNLSLIKEWYYYDFILVTLNTGLRLGEVAGIQVKDVNLQAKTLNIRRSLKRSHKDGSLVAGNTKSNKIRPLPINDIVCRILSEKSEGLEKSDFIFKNDNSSLIDINNFCTRKWKPKQIEVGVTNVISFHDLRHTFASIFMMNGGDLFTLQKLLGHTSVNTTEIYAHLSPSHMREASEVVSLGGVN